MNTKFPTDAEREVIEDELALWIESTDEEWDDHDIADPAVQAVMGVLGCRKSNFNPYPPFYCAEHGLSWNYDNTCPRAEAVAAVLAESVTRTEEDK